MSLEVKGLCFAYGRRPVLKDICFRLSPGQVLSVLGPNGVGKSTLFRCILGLLKPQAGDILIDGESVAAMSPRHLARKIAYIPQSHAPAFSFTVQDMVLMGTASQLSPFFPPGKTQVRAAQHILEQLGIVGLAGESFQQISGGEQQLCLLARAMVQGASLLVLDEPAASLDYGNRIRVMRILRNLSREGYGVLLSTHDPDQAYLYSDEILALYDGSVLALGPPEQIIQSPLISRLYGVEVEVCSLREDNLRVCVPAQSQQKEGT